MKITTSSKIYKTIFFIDILKEKMKFSKTQMNNSSYFEIRVPFFIAALLLQLQN